MGDEERGVGPDLSRVVNLTDFILALGDLRASVGNPSYRALAKKAGAALKPPRELSYSTVSDVFDPGRRRLDLDVVLAIVRALGVSEQEVGAWRQACVRAHGQLRGGDPVGVFRQLPADAGTFTGRETELAQLWKAVEAREAAQVSAITISAIEGMAGVGKTLLAVHAAHQMVRSGRFGDLQLYVNLRGFDPDQSPATPGTVLDGFLRQLGVPSQHIPASVEERAAMFRDRINGKQALILLDNASDEEQVRPLIPADPNCLVLITSRRSLLMLDAAVPLYLDVFTPTEAVALLARIAGEERIEAEPSVASQVAELCGCLPLALALAGAKLRSRPAWTLADLLAYLQTGGLDAFTAGNRRLRLVFDLSYQGLPARLRRLFCLLGTHPGPEITAADAAAVADVEVAEAQEDLERLQDEHLLTQPIAGRYVLHDLLQRYARHKAETDVPEDIRNEAGARLLGHYIMHATAAVDVLYPVEHNRRGNLAQEQASLSHAVGFDSADAAQAWMDAEAANLVAGCLSGHAVRHPDRCQRLAMVLFRYLEVSGRHHDAIAVHTAAVRSAQRRHDDAGQAKALTSRAAAYWHLGDYEPAVEDNLRALELCREVEGTGRLQGQCLGNLGIAYDMLARHDEALDCMRRALTLFQEADDVASQAAMFHNIASIQEHSGRIPEALASQLQGLELARHLPDSILTAYSLSTLGTLEIALGHRESAGAYLCEALELARVIGHRPLLVTCLNALGECVRADDPAKAIDQHREAMAIAAEVGDRYGQATAQEGIGDSFHALGDQRQAEGYWRLALSSLKAMNARGADALSAKVAACGGVETGSSGSRGV